MESWGSRHGAAGRRSEIRLERSLVLALTPLTPLGTVIAIVGQVVGHPATVRIGLIILLGGLAAALAATSESPRLAWPMLSVVAATMVDHLIWRGELDTLRGSGARCRSSRGVLLSRKGSAPNLHSRDARRGDRRRKRCT